MEEKGVFKNAVFGGFDRQSVLDYIKNLTDTAEDTEKELTKELLESAQRNDELLSMTKEKQAKITQLEDDLAREQDKAQSFARDLERTEQDLQKLKEQLESKDKEIAKLQELMESQNDQLRVQNERVYQLQSRNDMLELKSKKYDESTMQLGCLLLDGQRKADSIIKDAQLEAEEIKKDAHVYVDQAKVQAAGIVANAKQSAIEIRQNLDVVQDTYGDFRHRIMDSLKGIVKLLDEADSAIEQSRLFASKDSSQEPEQLEQKEEPAQEPEVVLEEQAAD